MGYITHNPTAVPVPVRMGRIGSGWMGAFHADSVARRIPGVVLAAIADPNIESARSLALERGTAKVTASADDIFADPVGMEAWARDDSAAALDAFRTTFTVYAEEKP
ncbi:hypothetical protein Q9R30_08785 [Arthrobacter sp. AB6]|uniref:hypothetical protein n=1 Tax=Arthrobacter sp. AB6 TaxID=2962570 RepID=UPI0028814793|nr:hypothetical protein [Arthrobacter sp. AB6]MDT0195447.1 hypothetical protein [Arthrobacter sp. AB6]